MRVTYFYAVMQSDCRGVVPSPGFSKSPLMPGKGKGKGAWMDKLCLCREKSDLTNIWCNFACNSILSILDFDYLEELGRHRIGSFLREADLLQNG